MLNATGEAIVAAVVLADGARADLDQLRADIGAEVAGYKRINEIVVMDQIPRLPSGKVLRRDLRANYRS